MVLLLPWNLFSFLSQALMSGKKRHPLNKKKNRSKKTKHAPIPISWELSPEIAGWILFSLSLLMLASLLNFAYGKSSTHWLGLAGYTIGWIQTILFGLSSYLILFYTGWIGWRLLFKKTLPRLIQKHTSITLLVISFSVLLTVFEIVFPQTADHLQSFFYTQLWNRNFRFHLGGAPFYYFYKDLPLFNLENILNNVGTTLIFGSVAIAALLYLIQTPLKYLGNRLSALKQRIPSFSGTTPLMTDPSALSRTVKLRIPTSPFRPFSSASKQHETLEIQPEKNLLDRPSLSKKTEKEAKEPLKNSQEAVLEKREIPERKILLPPVPKGETSLSKREKALIAQKVYNGDFSAFSLPSLSLLSNSKKTDQSSLKKDLKKQAEVLEETLLSFGIEAKVGQINCGPTITSFEVHPAIGVKVQKIKALENDIALNMEAKSIRILAPIPGKAAIGIEVPNPQPQEVGFKDMMNSYLQGNKKFHIPVLLGQTVSGDYVMEDLTRMPHVIIAGATGSGKSVCINTLIMSILMTAKPDEIKLIMVDPKKVELTPYTRLPHMLAPVITEPAGACTALKWLVKEMELRYEILKIVGFRNISSFNTRTINQEFEASLDKEIPSKMHYIVCIIDELADLMMVSSNDMETSIARIAQMARAVGIHLVLATQRPSREVITGLIKANFPTRISFKVSSRVNSQIILDEIGAESLLGNGDMLFLPPGAHHLIRAQGAYIRDEDINGIIEAICSQAPPQYRIASFDQMEEEAGFFGEDAKEESTESLDPLYDQAVEIVMSTGNASTTFLQRKLKLGYARAASIMDQLEKARIVSPADGSRPRKVLVKASSDYQDEREEESME